NTSTDPVDVWCFYENANSHCTNTGFVCLEASECCGGGSVAPVGCGQCRADWNETDFRIGLTPRQPIGWLASQGLAGFDGIPPKSFGTFPLSGVFPFVGIGGSRNAGSRLPPVPEPPFHGAL